MNENEAKAISVVIAASDFYAHAPELFQSLDAQNTNDFHIIVVDDGSVEGCELDSYDRAMVLRNMKPLGFARAMNQALALSLARWEDEALEKKYVLFVQPEIILDEETLTRLKTHLDEQSGCTVAGATLYRGVRSSGLEEELEVDFTDEVLHAGFEVTKSRSLNWTADSESLFAPAPECFMLRASFLHALKEDDAFLDESLTRIPALVELLWRTKLYGGRMDVVDGARAWKQLSAGSAKKTKDEKRQLLISNIEFHNTHVKLTPNLLRLRQAPWLFAGWIRRCMSLAAHPELWGLYLHKTVNRLRVAKKRARRFSRTGKRAAQMKDWFV